MMGTTAGPARADGLGTRAAPLNVVDVHEDEPMGTTSNGPGALADALQAARERAFVGRDAELSHFRTALAREPGARPIHYVHGPGGIGKSMVLRRFAAEARRLGRPVAEVDARTVAPTPEGFLAAAGAAVHTPGIVVLVDTFEMCQGLEGWLWERFAPALPADAVLAIAGRLPPEPRRLSDPGWADLLKVTALRNLPPADAMALLTARGVPAPARETLLAFTGGNPLALTLGAAVARAGDPAAAHWKPEQDVIAVLLPQLVGETPGPRHRRALEICAHAYVTSESLLRALMGDDAPELFDWLRRQPFVETASTGLFPHDAVREVLEADLRWRDPEGFASMHAQMRDYFLAQLRAAPEPAMLAATGALIYLYRADRRMCEFHGWREVGTVEEQPYEPAHREDVLRLAEETEGAASAEVVGHWLDRRPESFYVYRSTRNRDIVAFFCWLRLEDGEGADADPVVAAAWRQARATAPARQGEHLGLARFSVHPPAYQRPSAPMTHMQWRATGEMVRAGRIAWSYVVMRDNGYWDSHLADSNMLPLDERPEVAGHRYAMFAHDWRAQPAGPWLQEKTAAMLAGVCMAGSEGGHRGELVVLSRPEFETAVRQALRAVRDPVALAGNGLSHGRLVTESGRGLRAVLAAAAGTLLAEPNGAGRHRALLTTYFSGVRTQEAAAERLGLPFSTYRRHLTAAVERLTDRLWHHELHGDMGALPFPEPTEEVE
ncbi:ATP-binding protein [Streptomyces sp. NPDC091215]|uniref:ATP-binding protein n=1 Tax=Streptomyces sp. NPDC091215 TaxID=3155192 RepID=UPI003442232E